MILYHTRTYIPYMHTYIPYVHTYIYMYIHTVHTYIHADTYIYTCRYMHTYRVAEASAASLGTQWAEAMGRDVGGRF